MVPVITVKYFYGNSEILSWAPRLERIPVSRLKDQSNQSKILLQWFHPQTQNNLALHNNITIQKRTVLWGYIRGLIEPCTQQHYRWWWKKWLAAWGPWLWDPALSVNPIQAWQCVHSTSKEISEGTHKNQEHHWEGLWPVEGQISLHWCIWWGYAIWSHSLLHYHYSNCCAAQHVHFWQHTPPWLWRATPSWTRLGDWGASSPSMLVYWWEIAL